VEKEERGDREKEDENRAVLNRKNKGKGKNLDLEHLHTSLSNAIFVNRLFYVRTIDPRLKTKEAA
jgi:hypothetical protein